MAVITVMILIMMVMRPPGSGWIDGLQRKNGFTTSHSLEGLHGSNGPIGPTKSKPCIGLMGPADPLEVMGPSGPTRLEGGTTSNVPNMPPSRPIY
eukprot:9886200-Karenia_brevis.AAC.1